MLIQAAVELAGKIGLLSRPKQEVGPVIGVLNLNKQGYKGFTKLGTTTSKGKYTRAQMWIPQRSGRGSNIKAEFIVDKAEYMLGLEGEKKLDAYKATVSSAAKATKDEALLVLSKVLNSADLVTMRKDYAQVFEELEGNLLIKFNDTYIHERPAVVDYWLEQENDCLPEEAICACCMQSKRPVRLHPKVSGGGFRAPLISFNSDITDSYGKKGTSNFPICFDCAGAYFIALQRLLKEDFPDPVTGEVMPSASFRLNKTSSVIYWGEMDHNLDLIDIFEKGNPESLPLEEDNSRFHYAVLSQLSTGRLTLEGYRDSTLSEAVQHLRNYYKQLEVTFITTDEKFVERAYTPYWYQYAMIANTKKKIPPSFKADLFECAMNSNLKFSRWMYSRALNRVAKHKVTPALASIIKAVLIRNYGDNEMTVELNPEHSDMAYQFGCLFATVEHIHRRVIRSNQTLSDTLFTLASTRPLTVQRKLKRTFDLCAKKLRMRNQGLLPRHGISLWYTKQINEIMGHIDSVGLPNLFDLKQQGQFVMGYYHKQNELWKPKAEEVAVAVASSSGSVV